jgi:hypothetical protein
MKKFIHSIFFLIISLCGTEPAMGQFTYQFDASVPINYRGQTLPNAWGGGLNSAQINTIDLNGDGIADLAIYDKTSATIHTYIFQNGRYRYAPAYAYLFPTDVQHFMILRDFNGNGRKDLFTSTPLGIKVYENIGATLPVWRVKEPFLQTIGQGGSVVNLQVNQDDMPAIIDLDGDGDLDILAFTFTGFDSFIRYYRNESVEKYGHAEALEFRLENTAWGDFQECDCGVFAFGTDPCAFNFEDASLPAQMERMHPGGKSILAIDVDGNGRLDLLTSHEECDELYFLQNIGESNEKALMRNVSNAFPTDRPANFPFLPTAYFEDMDGDGIHDLVVSPNMIRNLAGQMDFSNSLWLYKNTGTNSSPDFQFQSESFLQRDMLDLGEWASPVLFDIDGDGDLDLLISADAMTQEGQVRGAVYWFENIGTTNNPRFQLRNDDLWQLRQFQLNEIQFQLTDLNQDGRIDLLLTASISGAYRSFFIYNQQQSLMQFSFTHAQQVMGLPAIFGYQALAFDLNNDGKKELLFARPSGGLDVYQHAGDGSAPQFVRTEQGYLGIRDDFFRSNLRIHISDLNNNGRMDLMTADRSGELRVFRDFLNFREGDPIATQLLYEPLTDRFLDTRFGLGIQISSGRITNANFPALILGTRTGGLHLLRNTEDLSIPPNRLSVRLFPNPVVDGRVNFLTEQNARMDILTLNGKLIYQDIAVIGQEIYTLDVSGFPMGMYIARFRLFNGRSEALRFIVKQ